MIGWKKAVKQGTTRDTWLVALAALSPLDQQAAHDERNMVGCVLGLLRKNPKCTVVCTPAPPIPPHTPPASSESSPGRCSSALCCAAQRKRAEH